MNRLLPKIVLTIVALLAARGINAQSQEPFWLGADISGTTELEARGIQLTNAAGEPRENTELMKELGLNAVRLRVWVEPTDGLCNGDDVLRMALRAKALGMALMIDFHYSDWWADPGKQNIPKSWKGLSYGEMCDALANHTREVLRKLKNNGIDVKWVQVGNETTDGFLWDVGRASTNMAQYAGLTANGYDAVKEIYPDATVIVHIDCGSDPKRYDFIFDGLRKYGAKWDMIGMSIYPYWDIDTKLQTTWQGTVDGFVSNIKRLYKKYGSETMIVETGVEAKKPVLGKQILDAIIDAAYSRCDGHCKGVFYWAPEAEGAYPLGAFDGNKPTVIMDSFTEMARKLKQ